MRKAGFQQASTVSPIFKFAWRALGLPAFSVSKTGEAGMRAVTGIAARFALVAATAGAIMAIGAEASAQQSRLDNIKRDRKIVIGVRESTPPYGFADKNGERIGWSIDLAKALKGIIEKRLKMELALEMKPVTPQTRIPLIVNGTIDAYFGSAGKSVERDEVIDFSLMTNAVCVKKLVPRASAVHSTADMAGKRVGVTQGSLEERLLTTMNADGRMKPPVRIVPFDKHSTGFIALSQGKTDVHMTMDDALLTLAMSAPNPRDWEVRGPDIFCTVSAIIVQQNDSPWRDMIDHAFCNFVVTGGYDALYDDWVKGPNAKAGYERELSPEVRFMIRNQCPDGSDRFVQSAAK
jgi:ABC-type amino acid transport substrate-binding protein